MGLDCSKPKNVKKNNETMRALIIMSFSLVNNYSEWSLKSNVAF